MKKLSVLILVITLFIPAVSCIRGDEDLDASLDLTRSSSTISTVFLVDVSGSMSELSDLGNSRIEAAIQAASDVIDVIEAEQRAAAEISLFEIALISFSNTGQLDHALTSDLGKIRSTLQNLYADGGTNLSDGLRLAVETLAERKGKNKQIILLSDGQPSVSSTVVQDETLNENERGGKYMQDLREEVEQTAELLKEDGICIYPIGFGNDTETISANAGLLQQIVSIAGCGAYNEATASNELSMAFIETWYASQGEVLMPNGGSLTEADDIKLWTVVVPRRQEMLRISTTWTGAFLLPRWEMDHLHVLP